MTTDRERANVYHFTMGFCLAWGLMTAIVGLWLMVEDIRNAKT